jgi:RND family efflux transporter MFP subunit
MKRIVGILIGLAAIAAGVVISSILWKTRPTADVEVEKGQPTAVRVMKAEYRDRRFTIPSQGLVEASRRSLIAAEVPGRVLSTSEQFEAGLRVKKNDVLLTIDPADFEAALAQTGAGVAEAKAALANEKARSLQAEKDWKKLGNGEEVPDLVRRGPQLRSAEAQVKSAEAALLKAEVDLGRTGIRAPYDAVIASTSTEMGSYLTPGAPVAEIFEIAPFEIRLPLSIDQVQFLSANENGEPTGAITILASAGGSTATWSGEIVRTEGEIDRSSRSVYIVARINPRSDDGAAALQPGQFVRAEVPGRIVPGLARLPFSAFLDLDTVLIVDPDNRLRFRDVTVVFREGDNVYISDGPAEGENVCLTELSRPIEGAIVTPQPAAEAAEEPESSSTKTSVKP